MWVAAVCEPPLIAALLWACGAGRGASDGGGVRVAAACEPPLLAALALARGAEAARSSHAAKHVWPRSRAASAGVFPS
jgi:hypothetical protein